MAGRVGLLAQASRPRWNHPHRAGEPGPGRLRGPEGGSGPALFHDHGGARSLDEASLTRARQLSGLKGYVTNIPANVMAAGEVFSSYHDLWHVEQSFRMSKTDLRAKPMFQRTREAIEAHLTIVFTALAISRTVQKDRTRGAERHQLRPLRSATISINGASQTFAPVITTEQQTILDAIQTPKLTH
jgi:hypothetical protein